MWLEYVGNKNKEKLFCIQEMSGCIVKKVMLVFSTVHSAVSEGLCACL